MSERNYQSLPWCKSISIPIYRYTIVHTLLLIVLICMTSCAIGADVSSRRNGVNLQPSYYNNGNVTFGWDMMKKYTQIQSVRIEIEPNMVEQGREWIRQAEDAGYHMIVTYHKYEALGSDDSGELIEAAQWWIRNYEYLSQAGCFDVNVMNEW